MGLLFWGTQRNSTASRCDLGYMRYCVNKSGTMSCTKLQGARSCKMQRKHSPEIAGEINVPEEPNLCSHNAGLIGVSRIFEYFRRIRITLKITISRGQMGGTRMIPKIGILGTFFPVNTLRRLNMRGTSPIVQPRLPARRIVKFAWRDCNYVNAYQTQIHKRLGPTLGCNDMFDILLLSLIKILVIRNATWKHYIPMLGLEQFKSFKYRLQ